MRRALTIAIALAITATTAALPAAAVGNPSFAEPVWARSFPDPFVLHVGSTWYAYGTDGDLGQVQLIRSTDLVSWSQVGDALGSAPSWAQPNDVWAPTVLSTGSGFVLFAAFLDTASGKRCIGKATSSDADGPFDGVDSFKLCDSARGGVIDPATYTSGATTYLLWKSEGVPGNDAEPPSIFSQPLSSSQALTGSVARIFRSRQPWEGTLAENPSMATEGGRLFLFYSGNEWESAAYGVGWALCSAPQGSCIAPPNRPLLTSTASARGPGGGTVFKDETGAWWLGFAAWLPGGGVTEADGQRGLFFRRLSFNAAGRPMLATSSGSFAEPAFTQRVAGVNRYDTAVAFSQNTVQPRRPITYIATGATYADALVAAPASGFEHSPVLLVERDRIADSVRAELARLQPGHIVVMGGTDAISNATMSQLGSYSNGSIHREAGVNQYHRSALVSRNTFDPNVAVAFVATGQQFPDGLAGGGAASANGGPLLLVEQNGIPVDVRAELDRLNPQRIVVLGGPAAVSHEVLAQLAQYSPRVDRVAGVNRYETAAALASSLFAKVGGSVAAVVIATGQNFPDAVAAGSAGWPVLLVPTTGDAPQVVKDALASLNPLGVVVLGGTGAVSDATLRSLGL